MAILGLLAVGDTRSDCVHKGIAYLLQTQRRDGSWWEKWNTGTGFPKVFYLKYHMYAEYFPLLAMATYQKVMMAAENAAAVPGSQTSAPQTELGEA